MLPSWPLAHTAFRRRSSLRRTRCGGGERSTSGNKGSSTRGRRVLLENLGDDAGTDRAAAFADGEAEAFGPWRSDLPSVDNHLDVVAGHAHLGTDQIKTAGDIRRAEVELRLVSGEERRVTATLFLGQHVDLGLELGVRRDASGLGKHLTTLHVFLLDTTKQRTDVVAGLGVLEDLVEHLDAGARSSWWAPR